MAGDLLGAGYTPSPDGSEAFRSAAERARAQAVSRGEARCRSDDLTGLPPAQRTRWEVGMAIMLNHTIVPAHDKDRAAGFLGRILGLGPITHVGPFAAVRVNPSLTLDFADRESFEPHHYAFQVSDDEF